jgi:CubicO group peptidase (beta-lactamase class C family)
MRLKPPAITLRSTLALTALIGLLLAGPGQADEATDAQVERVIHGLRPPVSFVGDPGWSLDERMSHYGVPGVSITVIDESGIAWTGTYGVADRNSGAAVQEDTLFQAGSVSKPVAAFGAMRMVDQGQLSLDQPVNEGLTSWKIPDNEFTQQVPVTLSHLLSHTGGLTVHGFAGYAAGTTLPTMRQILDGQAPANSAAIRVDLLPGSRWRYSGGGYTIAQLLMTEVSGQTFPTLMQKLVLKPIGMRESRFDNPLPPKRRLHAAAGVLPDGKDLAGKRHSYPEMAAAGLWTTSADLARFAIEMQKALAGNSKLLQQSSARAMLEVQADAPYGRGFALTDVNGERYFGHNGWDEGFCALLLAHPDQGIGVVVMINANQPALMREIQQAVAFAYQWPGFREYTSAALSEFARETAPGRYRYNGEQLATVVQEDEKLYLELAGETRTELVPIGDERYLRRERPGEITLGINNQGLQELSIEARAGQWQRHPQLQADQKQPRELLLAGDTKAALAAYQALKEAGDEAASETYLNQQGLGLLQRKQSDAAIQLLTLNTQLYPDSANTWDSLGYAWMLKGDSEQARKHYRKALSIDPEFASAKAALLELEE